MVAESFKRSHRLLALCVALAFASAALALGFAVTANAQEAGSGSQPTISSDKADYPPGGTVILTGSGWQPGESVNIFVNDDEGKTWNRNVDVTADENGNIRDEFQLPSWFVAKYSVKATGAQSGEATTSFTDAAAQLQGQSNPPCTSGGQCDSGWQSTNLSGWQELDEIPLRLKFPATGTFTINIDFDHFQTSSGSPGIQNLYGWNSASGVTLQGDPTLTTGLSGGKWRYTLTANVTNANAILNFKGNLAAGAHNFTGSSLALGGSDVGGTVQVAKPAARPGNPDLAVDKTGPTTAARDDVVTYTLNYQNKSAATSSATGVQLTDVLPSGVTYVANSCSGSCTVAGNEIVWNLGTLAPGASGSRTLQVRIPANANFGTAYTDLARIRSAENDLNSADNDDSLTTTVQFNRNPVANNDSYNVNEDQTLTVSDGPNDVLANDTDADNDTLTVTGNTQPAHGSVTVNANGSFTYTPNANFNGSDSFDYTVSDGKGGTDTGTVNITVDPVNDTPTITPNIGDKTILEDTDTGDISFTVGDAESAAGDLIVAASSSDTTLVPNDNANLILGGSGANRTIKVRPAADRFGGPATITLTVSDGTGPGSQSATETFDVNVTPVNDAPSFDVPANAPPVNEDAPDQTVANFATNILVGPFELSQTITEFQVTSNSNPSLFSAGPAIDSDTGDLTYTPAANAFGTAEVTVRAKDDGGTANGGVDTSAEKTFSITLNPVNDDPNAVDDSANAEEDGPAIAIDVLANDNDGPDTGETLSVTSVTQPPAGEGSTQIIESGPDAGKVRFTPSADFFGQTTFNYTISDGNGGTDTATVTVDVSATNDPPEIGFTDPTGDTQTVDESVTQTRTYSYTLDNTDGPASQVTESCGGATKVDTPEANSFQCVFPDGPNTHTVSVTADDGQAQNNTASDSIEVTVNNVAPTANDDSASADEEGPAVEVDVLANDTDPANGPSETNDPLTITNVSGPPSGEGSVEIIESGKKVRFTPNPNFEGSSTSFSYTISDGDGGTDTANVTVSLNPVNDAPVNSVPGTQSIDEDQARVFSAANGNQISISDIDAGSDDVKVTLTADHGKLTLGGLAGLAFSSGDGTGDAAMTFTGPIPAINTALNLLTFTPAANYDGSDAKLTIETNDQGNNGSGGEKTDTDSIAFDITADNDPPVIDSVVVANTNPVQEGSPATIEVTATDPDTPSSELRYSFDCDNDGTFEKGPQASNTAECTYYDNGTYPVKVKVTDDADNSDTDSVNVTVVNVAPAAAFDAAPNTLDEGQDINLSLTNVVDPGTLDTHEYRFKCGDADWTSFGSASTHTCPTTDDGQITVKGQVRDDDGGESPVYDETITVNNVPPNVDPPEGGQSGENQSSDEGQDKNFDVGSFTDPGADGPWNVTVNWGDGSQNTTFQIPESARLQDGSFDLSGNHKYDENGEYDVTVTVAEDGQNAPSGQASFKITVNNVAPTATFDAAPNSINEGDNINLSLKDVVDPGTLDTHEYRFDCGNGTFGAWTELPASGEATISCPAADDGNITVRGQVRDDDGGESPVYEETVTVSNTAPRVTLLSGPEVVKESTTAERTYTFTATDAGDDELTIDVGCGANGELVDTNGADPGGTFEYDPATGEGSFKCVFPDGGPNGSTTSNVTVKATDDNGVSDSDNQVVTVTVENDNPQATFNAPSSVNEGDEINLSLTDATDPAGSNDTLEYAFKCGDGDWSAFGASNTASCQTNDNGQVIVKGQVRDEDGGQSEVYEKTVTVNNVAPRVVLSGPSEANEGDTKTYNFTVTDPGSADTFTVENGFPTCGQNGQVVPGSLQTNANGGSFECRFPDGDATTNVEIQVRDDDGALDSDSQRVVIVEVANVAPVLTVAADQAANEGTGKDFDLGSFTDPGDDASWNVTVDWGDGSQNTTFDSASPGNLPQRPHTYADDGSYTVTVTVAEAGQNAPSDSKTFTVTVANVRPTVSLTGPSEANEGDTKTYNFTVTDPGTADTHTIDRSCGANGTEVQGSFSYDENTRTGSFECRFPDGPAETNVTVKATDDRESDQDNQRVVVTVANVAPTVDLTGADTANEGDKKTYNFTVADPGDDEQTIDWDCGANGEKVGGSFSYDPATKTGSFECRFPDGPAQTNVSVTVNDGDGSGSDSITVNVANVAPTANDDQMNTTELQEVTANLLDNDSDPGNDLDTASLTILGASGPNDGGVTIGALLDGNVTYTPDRGFIGGDSFRYEVCDDDGDCSSANVQVTVGPVDCNAQGVIRGTQRADILRGTAGNDIICAFAGKDTIYGGGGDDLLIGDSGDDRMWGQDGGDVMRGGANTDAMDGGLGDDYMSGDSGRDVMLGRGGSDFLDLLDGSAGDAGNGGAGTDTCAKDAGDRTVSCERRQ